MLIFSCVISFSISSGEHETYNSEDSEITIQSDDVRIVRSTTDKNQNKISDSLENRVSSLADDDHMVDVIIALDHAPTTADINMIEQHGGVVYETWNQLVFALHAHIPSTSINKIALSEGIVLIEENAEVQTFLDLSVRQIRARPTVWNTYGYDGNSSQAIAIIDTGIDDSHPDLDSDKIVVWKDFTTDDHQNEIDILEHGTHCAGIAAGNGSQSGLNTKNYTWGKMFLITGLYHPIFVEATNSGTLSIHLEWNDIFIDGNGEALIWIDKNQNEQIDADEYTNGSSPLEYSAVVTPGKYLIGAAPNGSEAELEPFYCRIDTPTQSQGDGRNLLSGVAPDCKLAGLKIFPDDGTGATTADIIESLEWLVANASTYNITVASLSFGMADGSVVDSIDTALNNTVSAGVVCVVAAGNSQGLYNIGSPGTAAKSITVGAVSDVDNLTSYSSIGNSSRTPVKPDVLAPGGSNYSGDQIVSVDSNDNDSYNWLGLVYVYDTDHYPDDYKTMAGTSMACPHVAGLAALIIDAMGSWSYTEEEALNVKKIILMTSYEVGSAENNSFAPPFNNSGKDYYEGYGRVCADAAIEAASMNMNLSEDYNTSFGTNATDKKVWARQISLNQSITYNFTMNVPVTGDYDLYLYNGTPDSNGEPILINYSTNKTNGKNETFEFTPNQTGTYYLVAKWYNGTGNATINATEPQAPILSNPSPTNGTTGINLTPVLNITVSDIQGDTMNITWYWNDSGTWYLFGSNNSIGNGTYQQNNSNFSNVETTYWWSVNCSDGTHWSNEMYHFTTRDQYNASPPSNFEAVTFNKTQINLSWIKGDNASHTYIERNTTQNWARGEGTNIYNSTGTSFNDNNLQPETRYYYQAWSWNKTDSVWSSTNASANNITNELPSFSSESPTNGSTGINLNPTLSVLANDSDSDLMNISFWTNASGSWQRLGGYHEGYNGTYTDINATNMNSLNTTYWWSVNCSVITYWTNETYHFTTRIQYNASPPSNFVAHTHNKTQINLSWIKGENASHTYIERNTSQNWTRGEGVFVYNGTGTSTTNSSLLPNTRYYYQAWSWNETDNVWSVTNVTATNITNRLPRFSSESPTNGSTGISTGTSTLTITIQDPDGDQFNWSITTSPNVGSNSETNASNGTKSCSISGLGYDTTYYWYVSCEDVNSSNWANATYHFVTGSYSGNGGTPPGNGGGQTAPNTPTITGSAEGHTNVIYSYTANTTDPDGHDIHYNFSWGDETYSGWTSPAVGSGIAVSKTHKWFTPGTYEVKAKAKDAGDDGESRWSSPITVLITELINNTLPNAPSIPSGPSTGLTNNSYSYSTSATDPDYDQIRYRFNWGDGTISNWTTLLNSGTPVELSHTWTAPDNYSITAQARDSNNVTSSWSDPLNITIELDSDGDGWSDSIEQSYETNTTDPNDYPLDTDGDGTPDEDSPDGKYAGDSDDDNDGLNDEIETMLGSDSKNKSDVIAIEIEGKTHYLVDTNGDAQSDRFYSSTGRITMIDITDDGEYLIDINGDGEWDYVYDPASKEVIHYGEKPSEKIPWLLVVIIGIIIAIIIILIILYKMGHIKKE